ncbi:MAG: hypothetical protein KIT83_09220 [Bryobacterales bacterium]|nr:hypothetical protein [Bryobacterales bacterium]
MQQVLTRRNVFAWLLGVLATRTPASAQRGQHFEGTRWYAWQPGHMEPKEWVGSLFVNAATSKLNFFHDHSNLLEVQFDNIGSFAYELAPQPTGVEIPPKGWPRMKRKSAKHLLILVYKDPRKGAPRGADDSENFVVRTAVFELLAANFGEVLEAVEVATGHTIRR